MSSSLDRRRADDEQTRAQIGERLDETLFVEAGAGTGKTRALVDRYVALVLAGCRVEELVAITFTEKAAAELAERVRAEIERRQHDGEGERALLERAISRLDRAQISTIHAFATKVLRSFAAEFEIDPSFEVQDDVAAERRFQESWRTFLENAGSDQSAVDAVDRALSLGLSTRDLQALAHALWTHGELAERLRAAPLEAPAATMPDLRGLREALVALDSAEAPADDRLRLKVDDLLDAIDGLMATNADDRLAALAAVAPRMRGPGRVGQAQNWGGAAGVGNARETATAVCESLQQGLAGARAEALAQVLQICVRFVVDEARQRRRDGRLIFDDLILLLRNLLRDDLPARRRLRARYRALLLDEFQDTDPLQVEIALAFAEDPDTGRIEPGRLFLVGDPKQSIYRFRRADMAIYAGTLDRVLADGGRTLELSLSRRSRECVLEFVNDVFATLIGDGDTPSVQPPYRPVHPERDELCTGPGVAVIGGPSEAKARDLRRKEAQQLAARCRIALEDGWEVWDRENECVRLAKYRDIAILVPTRAILQPLESALAAAGVPFRVEGGSLVLATQEVRDLINCLTAIDDPSDDVAVVAALRSAAYACSDVELAEHRLCGGSFNYLSPALASAEAWAAEFQRPDRVVAALNSLRAFHETRHEGSISRLIERFVAARRLVEAGLYDAANRNAFRRARFVIEQARLFEAQQPESLRSWIEWMEGRAGDAVLDHEGSGLDDDEDAVRVLTIHAAKGLEFPIVFLGGLGAPPRSDTTVIGFDRASGAIAVSIGAVGRNANCRLGPVEEIKAREEAHQQAERDRLLYVAATRARDHLLISVYHQPAPNRRSSAQRLIESDATLAAGAWPECDPIEDQRAAPFATLDVDRVDFEDDVFEAQRVDLLRRTMQPPLTSATALGLRVKTAAPNDVEVQGAPAEAEREDAGEPWSRGRAGTHRGRAVHAALQVLPWDAGDATIDALARAQAVAEAIPGDAARVAELLRRALATSAAARARAARRAQREVPFAVIEQGVIVEGFVDVVIEGDEGLEIVDWKTDAVPAAAVPGRLQSYQLQAGLYALALEAATGRPVHRITYVFVDPGVEISPGEPAELAAAARARLAEVAEDRAG